MTLPGFETATEDEPPADPTGSLGLSGRLSVVAGKPLIVDLIRKGWRWALVGAVLMTLFLALLNIWPRSPHQIQVDHTLPPGAHDDLMVVEAPDSLGVRVGDLAQRWNEVEVPPRISRGLIRSPETGRFDGFSYRFSNSSMLAGAYDKSNDFLYALMASTWLSDENAHRMTIHLCHVVSPFSQECIDAYFREGLARMELEEYRDLQHRSEWTVGENLWRLTIADNIQTIRVLGPGAD